MTALQGGTRVQQLWFTAPFQLEVREASLPAPGAGELRVKTLFSAVSAGTELLFYRGQIPATMSLDSTLETLRQQAQYPAQFGYACVGEVQQVGSGVDPNWAGRRVFSFQAHASQFLARPEQLIALPDDVSARAAVFLPNMETAVNLVHDGRPLLGERAVVLGQGVVGLLLSSVLALHPLASLTAVEGDPGRQALACRLGVQTVCRPTEAEQRRSSLGNADLIYEVSGHPQALDLAVALSGYTSRIVIGSWYGNKPVAVDLGGEAHRNRLSFITSQVSTLSPALSGRWDKARRFDLAWEMIRRTDPTQLITHSTSLENAHALYDDLDQQRPGIVQAIFHYPE